MASIAAVLAAVVITVILAFGVIESRHTDMTGSGSTNTTLPAGCKRPANGYLIIASEQGFNDSKPQGAPTKSWPIINVSQGSTVRIVVCNADSTSAHGFQISHYFDGNIESVRPNEVVVVSFVADQAGSFQIYCSIFCPPHIFMQSGVLRVTP